ncbi:nucleotidyltransferase domain protein [Clostridium baratii str. Sullivan]|uniref:Nucleotidyltransferase domain protein n=1 Tax=Clostridium baratii str. Sullivan TaxID=1415775 RepID=A0A0A7FZB7_9CLOT|nr:nucleotidyltransferase domain-containing protein [Clostridium baratii]AIY84917.1 nucleotidyltransferase domain protein [Clostridium baratii str. Sullivan]
MKNIIIEYQKAFNEILDNFKNNKNVIAVFTFGSIVSGDIWEESDIDFFVIYNFEYDFVRDIYSEIYKIPVHTRILSKEKFLSSYKEDGSKGTARNILKFSKLVFSRDKDINNLYNRSIYVGDEFNHIDSLEYLSRVIKDVGICKKYIQNDRVYTAYEMIVRSLDSFSKLYLNLNGYTVSKDAIRMVINLNDDFKRLIDDKLFNGVKEENIIDIINYINIYVDKNILKASKIITDILSDEEEYLSASEIKNKDILRGSNIKLEQILKRLLTKGVIKKKDKEVIDSNGNVIISENVYGIE